MTISTTMLLIIIGCCLVTLIPRIVPFIIVKRFELPTIVRQWLGYIPICILTALVVQGLWTIEAGYKLVVDWRYLLALIPTTIAAIWTRSLAITVIVGVLAMALLRLWLPALGG